MNLKLSQGFELSNEHASSSYGMTVLVKNGHAWGPGDIVWSDGGPGILARELVIRLVNNMPRSRRDHWTHAEVDLVQKFCEQLNVLFRLTP